MITTSRVRRARAFCLLTGISSGLLYFPACSITDIGENIIAGGLSFVESYTEEWLNSIFPPPGEIGSEG